MVELPRVIPNVISVLSEPRAVRLANVAKPVWLVGKWQAPHLVERAVGCRRGAAGCSSFPAGVEWFVSPSHALALGADLLFVIAEVEHFLGLCQG